ASTSAPAAAASTSAPTAGAITSALSTAASTSAPAAGASTSGPAPAASTSAPSAASTSAPAAGASTSAPSAAASTSAPAPAASTSAPAAGASTSAPDAEASTSAPSAVASTSAPATVASTSAPASANASATSSTPTPSTATSGSRNPCQQDSCKGGSSCVSLNNTFFCLCSEGYYYNSSTCNKGKIFPGKITVKISETTDLEHENSVAYENLYLQVTNFFNDTFSNSEYGQTVILKVSTTPSARYEMRASNQLVEVEVVNIFRESTTENESSIFNAIDQAIKSNPSDFTEYIQQDRCDYYGCKRQNEQDECPSGLLCECKEGLERPNPQIPLCVALGPACSDTCNAENNRQCLVRSAGNAECLCLPGYKEDKNKICQACPFGYSGVGCENPYQLILTIVGTIAGILILSLVIAFVLSLRSNNKNKNVEEQNLIENYFQNLQLQETGFSNLGAGNLFPKIKVDLSRDDQPQSPYITQGSIPRPDY
uniref:Mucin 13A n=1 Tax=Sus scrofa TaxID=9823 RepID=A0A8D1K2P2_PIG